MSVWLTKYSDIDSKCFVYGKNEFSFKGKLDLILKRYENGVFAASGKMHK